MMRETKDKPVWSGKVFSSGWVEAQGGVADVVDPSNGTILGVTGVANGEDVAAAAKAAKSAQKDWAALPFTERAAIVRKAAEKLKEREHEFADWNVRECGAIRPKGLWESGITYEQMHQAAGLAFLPNGSLFPSSIAGRLNICQRVPVGVVGVIAPWNFPLFLSMRSVAPALVLGNAVILKPDVQTAVTGGALIAEIFSEAGIPEGVLHVLPGGADAGESMVANPEINMISFTGSTQVGRSIGEKCGKMLKKVALELGVTMFTSCCLMPISMGPSVVQHGVPSCIKGKCAWQQVAIWCIAILPRNMRRNLLSVHRTWWWVIRTRIKCISALSSMTNRLHGFMRSSNLHKRPAPGFWREEHMRGVTTRRP